MKSLAGTIVLLLASAAPLPAVSVQSWTVSSAREFSAGSLEGTAVDEEGHLRLGLTLETAWGPERGIVWDVAPEGSGGAFLALSSPGRVLWIDGGGEAEVWYRPKEESLVAAVAADGEGGVFFGLSPDGTLYHASGPGVIEAVADSGALFVWALAASPDGSVWIGTGMPGMLLRYGRDGELRTLFESGDDPVRCIAATPDGGVVFGTGGRGRVIRVGPDGRPFVLLDAEEAEIAALEVGDDGTVFALAAEGSKQIAAAGAAAAAAPPMDTVRVVATPPEDDAKTKKKSEQTPGAKKPRPSPGFGKTPPGGALYSVAPDGGSRRIWQAKGNVPFALVRDGGGRLLVGTGDAGRIFGIDPRGQASILLDIPSDQASALARGADGRILIGGTTDARLERLGPKLEGSGSYYSAPLDAKTAADWGRLSWEADTPRGARLRVAVRAGNTAEPDDTWSEWTELDDGGGEGAETGLPRTRWFQSRVDMQPSSRGESPVLHRLELAYLPRNRAPVIEELAVQPAGIVWTRNPTPGVNPRGPLVADDPVARKTVAGLQPGRQAKPVRKSYELGARTIVWKATDPDKDTLVYRLEFRREGSDSWLPLAGEIVNGFYSWDARGMPDGLYRVRLTAEDSRDNPEDKQFSDRRTSGTFRIDNTAPSVGAPAIREAGGGYRVKFVASDTGGNVAAVEVAVDGGGWQPVDPLDGVADSAEEHYQMTVEPSEEEQPVRSMRVRVTDAAGNLGGDAWVLEER